jgi:hypothetical protein
MALTPLLKICIELAPPLHRLLPHPHFSRHQPIAHYKPQATAENFFLREIGAALNHGAGFELERVRAAEEQWNAACPSESCWCVLLLRRVSTKLDERKY